MTPSLSTNSLFNPEKEGEAIESIFSRVISETPKDLELYVNLSLEISNRLAYILKQKGLSQKEFAKKMGKTEAEVCRWLAGTQNLTIRTIAKIEAELGVSLIQVTQNSTEEKALPKARKTSNSPLKINQHSASK